MDLKTIKAIIYEEMCQPSTGKCYGVNEEHCEILKKLLEKVIDAYLRV